MSTILLNVILLNAKYILIFINIKMTQCKTGLPLMKNVIKPLAKSVLIPLALTAGASAADVGIHKKY